MKRAWPAVLLLAGSLVLAPPVFAADEQASRTIEVPVDLKDPYTAHLLGLVPLLSFQAAYYVGTNRFTGSPPSRIWWSGSDQFFADIFLSSVGYGLFVGGLNKGAPTMPTTVVGIGMMAMVPLSHLFFHAPYWGNEAVRYNRHSLKSAGFPEEADTPPYE